MHGGDGSQRRCPILRNYAKPDSVFNSACPARTLTRRRHVWHAAKTRARPLALKGSGEERKDAASVAFEDGGAVGGREALRVVDVALRVVEVVARFGVDAADGAHHLGREQ